MWFIFHLIPSKGLFKYHIIISFGPLQTPLCPSYTILPFVLPPPPHYLAWYFSLWPNLHIFFNLFSHFLVIFGRNCNNLELYHIRLTSLHHSHGFLTSRANPPPSALLGCDMIFEQPLTWWMKWKINQTK